LDLSSSANGAPAQPAWQQWVRPALAGLVFVVLNVLAYLWLESSGGRALLHGLRDYAVLGVFVVMLLANATVVVPVPWPAVLIPIAQQSDNLALVLLAGALGSAIGESVAFFVGRSGRGVVEDTRFYRWVQNQLHHPLRAAIVLFALAAPPNPLFDVAGLTAGAMGLPFWMFFCIVFAARIIRLWLILTFAGLLGLG
jgi:membrane protein YqaA with SNARE-associated domain